MSDPQHEPTMEEILTSIRKIISSDEPATAPAAALVPASVLPPVEEPDVLELTQEVELAPQQAPPPSQPVVPEPPHHDVVFKYIEETSMSSSDHSDIFSNHTRKAMDDVFANIPEEHEERAPAPRVTAPIAPVDGASVENVFERAVRESFEPVLQKYLSDNTGTVIERMKPLIREWMDEHFPALLEGAVRGEVERVVKARGAKR